MPNYDHSSADVLLVTVTSAETQAVFDALKAQTGQAHTPHQLGDKTCYELGVLRGAWFWLLCSEQGAAVPGGALATVFAAIQTLRPAAVILVGVGFGTQPQRQQIGDVLVASQLQLYEPQRVGGTTDVPQIVPSDNKASVSPRLLDRFRHGKLAWPPDRARVEFGLLLSGEKLVEHPAALAELLAREPLALGGELEGAGLYVAAFHSRVDWIVVRGISGWPGAASADPRADRALAARNAARFIAHTLAAGDVVATPIGPEGRSNQPPAKPTPAPEALSSEMRLALAQIRDPSQPLTVRLEAGATLGRLGDPRLLDLRTGDAPIGGYWCPIEPGLFWSGDDQVELKQVTLPYAYKIARFLVTNAEYRRFVEADGYFEQRWWSAQGWTWRLPRGHPYKKGLRDLPLTLPWFWGDEEYDQPSQPVAGLSRYEARAYCAWLTAQGHQHGWLPDNMVLRLPTWLEWQRAARHTDRRRFPWGDAALTPERANYKETGIGRPSPVGCFPAGQAACGALDLVGNLWEWTSTSWWQPDQQAPLADTEPLERLIIGGGAFQALEQLIIGGRTFHNGQEYLCYGVRNWRVPSMREYSMGFRVIWSPRSLE